MLLFLAVAFGLLLLISYFIYRLWTQNMSLKQQNLEEKLQQLSWQLAQAQQQAMQQLSKEHLDKQEVGLDKNVHLMKETLLKMTERLSLIEKDREGEKVALLHQLKMVAEAEHSLRKETSEILKALKHPSTGGSWGELHLKRVVEMAGLVEHVDFVQQATLKKEDGIFRPDMVIHLPQGRRIIVDSKAPMQAFLELGVLTDENAIEDKKREFVRHLKLHVQKLAKKEYAQQVSESADFVVLFLPTESLLATALNADPGLYETAIHLGIIMATPSTLIALLRMAAMGWRDEKLSLQTQELKEKAEQLLKHLQQLSKVWSQVGSNLEKSVESYNKFTKVYDDKIASKIADFGSFAPAREEIEVALIQTLPLHTDKS